MRLPRVVGGWAAECWAVAKQGVKPFPARVRFRPQGPAVEVSFVDHEPRTIASPGRLAVYIDESGSSGDAAIVHGGRIAGAQASFGLVALGEEGGSGALARIVAELRGRHGVQATEIKARAMDRRPQLVLDLVTAIGDAGLPVFIELMDKAYFVATNIVSYVLAREWLSFSLPSARTIANVMADVLAEHVDQAALVAYAQFAKAPDTTTFGRFAVSFQHELTSARNRTTDNDVAQMLAQMEEIFEEAVEAHRAGVPCSRFLPPPDLSLRDKPIAMLPHVSAFTNLYARVNLFSPAAEVVHVVHDGHSHFAPMLTNYALSLESNDYEADLTKLMPPGLGDWKFKPGKFTLTFEDSEASPGIQAADVLSRFLTRRMNAVINGSASDDDAVVRTLWTMNRPDRGLGVNIVSTTKRYESFWAATGAAMPPRPSPER
jgi:hypothetical protein